ncbi:MAG: PDZ domain-containing protein [Clostridia bacterium]|nr:PDZ domain-containing protein [Clostridia bacterium]
MRKQRWLALMLCILLLLPVCAVQAEGERKSEEQYIVEAVVKHLLIHGRYEDISEKSLYRAAVEKVIAENPELHETVLKGMLESIDAYSEYYTKEESESFITSVSGEVSGIGVTLDFSNPDAAVIASIIPDTPAEKAGLQVGDVIVSANGVNLRNAMSEIILSHVRGEEGSEICLEIERDGVLMQFTMIRARVVGTSITTEELDEDGTKILYIRIHSFVSNTAEKFSQALKEADSKGIKNLILDLRSNGGGILEQAVLMAQEFVPVGSPVTTADYKIKALSKKYTGNGPKTPKYKTVILMNQYSASASEVFAAALHENGLATTVGENTYGKGTIQSINTLATGGLIKYTTGFYLTPLGNNINGVGLAPDIGVENSLNPIDKTQYKDFQYTRVYKEGDTGEEVRIAKEILTTYGMYAGEIDEVFDSELTYAIYAFQSQANLFPYGEMDITTQINLRNYLDIVKLEQDDQLATAINQFKK